MGKNNGLSALEKPVGSMKILMHLHRHEKATITHLLKSEQLCQKTTYCALSKLQKAGLVFQEESLGFPLSKYYFLTDKGKVVSEQLGAVVAVLGR
ncbi:MAG: MarR family winged helix-turn-helix transcriptional regulator [Thermoplasmata archaeon]|nr:MarR family winged helix-turn-helix transcriptional regulator [Thermoplasmata archaeon]